MLLRVSGLSSAYADAAPVMRRAGALLIALVVSTHQAAATGQATGRTTSFTLHSAILNEDRAFQIYIPPEPGSGIKAIYVLDGQAQFKTVVDALSALGENRHLVIGVGNIWLRDRDYTPTRVSPSASVDAAAAAVSGGGERFFAHLANELLPYVDSRYPVGSSRILIGHSLGGLLAVNILLNHPGVFGRFIVINPSMWRDNGLPRDGRELAAPSIVRADRVVSRDRKIRRTRTGTISMPSGPTTTENTAHSTKRVVTGPVQSAPGKRH